MGSGKGKQSGWLQGKALMCAASILRLDKCVLVVQRQDWRMSFGANGRVLAAALIPRTTNTADLAEGTLGGGGGGGDCGGNAILVESGADVSSHEHARQKPSC
eukprot:13508728-Ditylum_brightwellii.AAC.1